MPEELTLLPCPNPECGADTCIGVHGIPGDSWHILCPSCEYEGPHKPTEAEAIQAHNAMPRALTWTTEPPKVAGWYWYKGQSTDNATVIVIVTQHHMNDKDIVEDTGLWAGPIPTPKEPTP